MIAFPVKIGETKYPDGTILIPIDDEIAIGIIDIDIEKYNKLTRGQYDTKKP